MRNLMRTTLLSGAMLVALASQAQAATTIGQTFEPSVAFTCSGGPDWEVVQHTRADGVSYAAPTAGILTSWSFESGTDESIVTLRVFRPTATPHEYTTLADDGLKTIPASSGLHTFPVRIPVQAGDLIGMRARGNGPCADETGNSADTYDIRAGTAGPVGSTAAYSHGSGWIWDISAALEPDADGDNFGDETQDACPTDPTKQGDCDAPEVSFTKEAPRKTDKSKVKFKFEANEPGATFECKKDKKPWKPCSSPTKMKRLDEGKHKFKVRATDAAGNTGPTEKDKFKVVE